MNSGIDTLRESFKLSPRGKSNNVSKIRKKVKHTINQDTNLSWRDKRKIKKSFKNATDTDLPDIIDVAKDVSQKRSDKKKQKIEKKIKKPMKSLMPSIGLLAGGLALGGFALAAQNMMPRQVTPLPLIPATPFDGPNMAMFTPMQLSNNIHNQADRNVSAIMSRGLNIAMAVSGLCLAEAVRPKTPEELEQKKQTRVKLLHDKIAIFDSNSQAYDDLKNDTAYKNLIVSREVNRFFDTENIDSIQVNNDFTMQSKDDFDAKIREIIASDDDTTDNTGVKTLYQEFKNLPKIQETSSSKEELQKHFIDKLFKKILYNKLRDSFISEDSIKNDNNDAKNMAHHTFDRLMKNSSLKKLYLDNLLSADSKEEIYNNIKDVILNKKNGINKQDLSAENLKDKLPDLLKLIGNGEYHKDNKETLDAIIKLFALNHANNLLDKNDSTYKIIKENKNLF